MTLWGSRHPPGVLQWDTGHRHAQQRHGCASSGTTPCSGNTGLWFLRTWGFGVVGFLPCFGPNLRHVGGRSWKPPHTCGNSIFPANGGSAQKPRECVCPVSPPPPPAPCSDPLWWADLHHHDRPPPHGLTSPSATPPQLQLSHQCPTGCTGATSEDPHTPSWLLSTFSSCPPPCAKAPHPRTAEQDAGTACSSACLGWGHSSTWSCVLQSPMLFCSAILWSPKVGH